MTTWHVMYLEPLTHAISTCWDMLGYFWCVPEWTLCRAHLPSVSLSKICSFFASSGPAFSMNPSWTSPHVNSLFYDLTCVYLALYSYLLWYLSVSTTSFDCALQTCLIMLLCESIIFSLHTSKIPIYVFFFSGNTGWNAFYFFP